jgi:hypothetical protein
VRSAVLARVVLTAVGWTGVAWAQTAGDALIREGVALRAQGRDAEAFERFRAAWTAAPTPRARAQMGWAAQALGRWRESEEMLTEALDARDDPWISANRTDLARSLAEVASRLGALELSCDVRGARVVVDGEARGTTPLSIPLRVPVGTVNVRVEADGYISVTREGVRIRTGEVTRERFGLTPEPATQTHTPPAITPPAITPPAITPPAITPPAITPPAITPPARRERGAWSGAGYVLLGLGGAEVVASAVLFATHEAAVTRYSEGVRRGDCVGVDVPAAQEVVTSCRDDRAALALQDPLRWVFLGVGVASLGAGVAMVLLDAPSARPHALRCAPWADLRGAGCALRF